MEIKKIETYFTFADISELSSQDKELIKNATSSMNLAYAPYSGFNVGASVLLDNGVIINGNNQENIAFPSGLCAERVALFYAGANYPNIGVNTIAVSVYSKDFKINDVVSPCGACRQVMAEYEQKQNNNIRVILHNPNDQVIIVDSIENLLPFSFKSSFLKKY